MENLHGEKELLDQIRSIILREDRPELQRLRNTIDIKEELSQKVSPIIEERLEFFKAEFPNEFKSIIDQFIDERIQQSQDEILNVIYPVVGKMIKKYIQHQFELLQEKINQQIKKTSIFSRKKHKYTTSVATANQILSDLDLSTVHEIYVIQKNSGILLGSYADYNIVDSDALAGMLTAIKLFVEDAFHQKSQNLETIRYENYQIFVYNFHTYYIAVAVEGNLSKKRSIQLEEALMGIGTKINKIVAKPNDSSSHEIKTVLTSYFD